MNKVFGSVDKLKEKLDLDHTDRESARFYSANPGGGGDNNLKPKVDITKAPADLKTFWDKTNTPPKQREEEFVAYRNKQARRGIQL